MEERPRRQKQKQKNKEPLYCCDQKYDSTRNYIECSSKRLCQNFQNGSSEWYHWECSGLTAEQIQTAAEGKTPWNCKLCCAVLEGSSLGKPPVLWHRLQENAQDSDEEEMPGDDEPSAQFWSQAFRKKIRDNDKLYARKPEHANWDNFGAVKAYFTEDPEEEKNGHQSSLTSYIVFCVMQTRGSRCGMIFFSWKRVLFWILVGSRERRTSA